MEGTLLMKHREGGTEPKGRQKAGRERELGEGRRGKRQAGKGVGVMWKRNWGVGWEEKGEGDGMCVREKKGGKERETKAQRQRESKRDRKKACVCERQRQKDTQNMCV